MSADSLSHQPLLFIFLHIPCLTNYLCPESMRNGGERHAKVLYEISLCPFWGQPERPWISCKRQIRTPGQEAATNVKSDGIKHTGTGNLILWDQTHRLENLFSWYVRTLPKLWGVLNLESLNSCPVLRIFSGIWRSVLSRSMKCAKLNNLSSTWISLGNFKSWVFFQKLSRLTKIMVTCEFLLFYISSDLIKAKI